MSIVQKIKEYLFSVLKYAVSIGSVLAIFFFFRWVGIKGIISFSAGLFIMAFLLLSKNPILRWVISFASAENYIDDIVQGERKNEKEKRNIR